MKRITFTATLLSVLLAACGEPAAPTPDDADTTSSAEVVIMTFNVENLFDNLDAPGKDDATYLPLADKQDAAHVDDCNTIAVEAWRDSCLELDWSDEAIDYKLAVVALLRGDRSSALDQFQAVGRAANGPLTAEARAMARYLSAAPESPPSP